MTCHAAIVSRELRIPCVVGTRTATQVLRDGEVVTVDGAKGQVFRGALVPPSAGRADARHERRARTELVQPGELATPLATRLYVNLAIAEHADEVAALPVDGVGLLRAEFMITDALGGAHPKQLIAEGKQREFVSSHERRRCCAIATRVRAAPGRLSHVRLPHQRVPRAARGRGVRAAGRKPDDRLPRLLSLREGPRAVQARARRAFARVREQSPNVHVMIPFVRTLWELEACLELIDTHALGRMRGLLRWVMAEVPSVAYRIPDYAKLGMHGVSIGSNDLTQLVLGVDRDSEICAELFDEGDAAVLDAIRRIIERGARQRHDLVAVRAGAEQPPRVCRAPGALRHHVDLGQPRQRLQGPPRGRRSRTQRPAGVGAPEYGAWRFMTVVSARALHRESSSR